MWAEFRRKVIFATTSPGRVYQQPNVTDRLELHSFQNHHWYIHIVATKCQASIGIASAAAEDDSIATFRADFTSGGAGRRS
jgi:hypothetical protein